MKRRAFSILLVPPVVLVMFSSLSIPTSAQFDQYGRWVYHPSKEPAFLTYARYTSQQAKLMMKLWNELGQRSSVASWAGDYEKPHGELAFVYFRFDPEVGYVRLTVHPCMPQVLSFDFGRVKDSGDLLEVTPAAVLGRPYTLVKITWGARRYLVDEAIVPSFCDYASGRRVHSKYWSHSDEFFLNEFDEEQIAYGLPILPAKYSRFELRPIEAKGIRVERIRDKYGGIRVTVRLDAGAKAGVRRGMHFYSDGDFNNNLTVKTVGPDWCIATTDVHNTDVDNAPIARDDVFALDACWTTCSECVERNNSPGSAERDTTDKP